MSRDVWVLQVTSETVDSDRVFIFGARELAEESGARYALEIALDLEDETELAEALETFIRCGDFGGAISDWNGIGLGPFLEVHRQEIRSEVYDEAVQ